MTAKAMARKLKHWRRRLGIGQREAARKLDISLRALCSYEQEVRRPSKFARKAILEIIEGENHNG